MPYRGMFERARQIAPANKASNPSVFEQKLPPQSEPRPANGLGMFGRGPARGIVRREDGDPGTLLNHLLYGRNGVDDIRNGQQRRALFDRQMSQLDREEWDASRQGKLTEQAIESLDPSMQPWARIAPGAAAQRMLAPPEEPETHYDSATGNFWQETQQGPRVVGRMPGWQRSGGAGDRAPPAGYRWAQGGNLEPIPGGPADARQTEAGRSRSAQMASSASSLENAISVLDQAIPQVDSGSAGLWGQMSRGLGGTDAYNLNQQLEPVRAILSFENLAEMRRNSATGGALGSIAVRELDLLGSTVRSLDTAQSPQQLRQALGDTRRQLARTLQAIRSAQSEGGGQHQQPSAQPRIIELDP